MGYNKNCDLHPGRVGKLATAIKLRPGKCVCKGGGGGGRLTFKDPPPRD